MLKEKDTLKSLNKLKDVDHLLDEEGMKVVKTKPRVRYLGDGSYKITDETLCLLVGEYNFWIIHDGEIEDVNELSPEEIVEKLKKYSEDKKERGAR